MHESAHVELRPLGEADTELILRWRSDPVVMRELFSAAPPTREEHVAWLRTLGDRRREFVILALPERVPIGTVGLSQINRHQGNAEYGIMIGNPAYRGRGFARAASTAVLAIAFDQLGLHRVTLHAMAANTRALRLYEGLGFRREGLLREHARRDGAYHDVVAMGLLESEWRTRQ